MSKNINIFELPRLPLSEEVITVLAESAGIRVERIVDAGQVTDWYDQPETEFVALLDGNAVIEYEDGRLVVMKKGDTLLIKPHEKHKVSYTSSDPPCVWICVFYA